MSRRRKVYPNYTVRIIVLGLLLLLAAIVGTARGWDVIFPNDYSGKVVPR